MGETHAWTLLIIVGMAAISVLTRCFFFISEREWPLPGWARRGLPYAPIAALAAVIAPDIVLPGGHWSAPWISAHLWGALAAAGYWFWRRHDQYALTLSITVGMLVYLPLHLLQTP